MRELKFRAWAGNNMWHDISIYQNEAYVWNNTESEQVPILTVHQKMLYGEAVIMQYTGLKDKNGKEIYEGDIVNIISDDDLDEHQISQIVWATDACGFFFEPSKESACGDFTVCIGSGETECFELEVLGNIYENPELLK